MLNRRDLIYEAAQEAADARDVGGVQQDIPICIYDLALALGVSVQFIDVDMEGIYERGPPSRIYLSPHRPLPRRAYNCAHELGHHRFGHGSTIDELASISAVKSQADIPEEVLANSFASAVLMPAIAIERAFFRRGISASNATPVDLYKVSCDFGVGYTTLLAHLTYTLRELRESQRLRLAKWTPADIRRMILDYAEGSPTVVIDDLGEAQFVELESKNVLVVPKGSKVDGSGLLFERAAKAGDVFRAEGPGLIRVQTSSRIIDVRVMKQKYTGLAQYRFMEEPNDQD